MDAMITRRPKMARAPYPGELEGCPWGIAPLPGREYAIAPACCGQCSDTQRVQERHFACSFQADLMNKEGWQEEDRQLTESGWEAVLSREVTPEQRASLNQIIDAEEVAP
jgi:hypothetical protein